MVRSLLKIKEVVGAVSLEHFRNLDKKYFKGKTDYCVNCINDYMIEETGEPLFYYF